MSLQGIIGVIWWLVCAGASVSGRCQSVPRFIGQSAITAGSYSGKAATVFSFTGNQASLAQLRAFSGGLLGQRKFLLKELSTYLLALAFPIGVGSFGLKAVYSGSPGFNETQVGLAYARRLNGTLDVGVQFNYHGIAARGYPRGSGVGAELGLLLHLSDRVHTGIHLSNLPGLSRSPTGDGPLPALAAFGIGYDAGDQLFVSIELEKVNRQPFNAGLVIIYRVMPWIAAKLGFDSREAAGWVAAGFDLSKFRLEFQLTSHPRLGMTPGLGLLLHPSTVTHDDQ